MIEIDRVINRGVGSVEVGGSFFSYRDLPPGLQLRAIFRQRGGHKNPANKLEIVMEQRGADGNLMQPIGGSPEVLMKASEAKTLADLLRAEGIEVLEL